jgi:calmodulin
MLKLIIFMFSGNGLIDETEFLTWVAKIQAIKDESSSNSSETPADDDDLTQDLVAAFR